MANGRTGTVFLEDFDVGMAESIGAELVDIVLDDETASVYALAVSGVSGPEEYKGKIPVLMADPEDVYAETFLPRIVISRGSITPDMARWQPGGYEYRVAAPGANMVTDAFGRVGPDAVETKSWARPFNIPYEIHIYARKRVQADRIFRQVGKLMWSYGQVYLTDSEGEERGYYAFGESNDALNEITEIADRTIGHTISVRVEGELDFVDPYITKTAYQFRDSSHASDVVSSPLGPGGNTGVSSGSTSGSGSPGGTGGRQFNSSGESASCRLNPFVKR